MPGCVVFAYFTIVTCHRLVTHELPDGFDPDTSWSGVAAAFVLVYGSAASGEVEPGTLAAGFMVGLVWFVAGLSAINVRRRLVAGPAHTKVNMAGKLCVVTGANAGVGLDTARELAKLGAEVVLACRSEVKATAAMLEIKSSFPKANVRFVKLDIGSLDSVRGCASQLLDAGVPIDVLINNAGVMLTELKKSSDRIDLAFQANRLGHFLLTTMLIPLLLKRQGRVVNVTSAIHRIPHKVDLNEVAQRNGKFPGMFEVYAETKLCNILFTAALNRQYGSTDSNVARIKAFAVHPGTVITTNVTRDLPPWIVYLNECSLPFMKLVTKAGKEGAYSSVTAATTLGPKTGKDYDPTCYVANCKLRSPSDLAKNPYLAKELWGLSERQQGGPDHRGRLVLQRSDSEESIEQHSRRVCTNI